MYAEIQKSPDKMQSRKILRWKRSEENNIQPVSELLVDGATTADSAVIQCVWFQGNHCVERHQEPLEQRIFSR